MELAASATERTTAATDALLALICVACVLHLRRFRERDGWKVGIWSGAFALLGLSAVPLTAGSWRKKGASTPAPTPATCSRASSPRASRNEKRRA